MNKQVKKLMSELRKGGYMNQLEELYEAVLSGDEEAMQEKIIEMLKDYEDDFKVLKITKKKLKGAVKCFLVQEGLSEECIKVILKSFTIQQYINFIEDMGEINSRDWLNILIYNELIEEK